MTPPDATAPARTARTSRGGTHRRAPMRPPRRASGPARGARAARAALPVPAGAGTAGRAAAAPPLALRLARTGARIGDARLLDRLVRGRGWIALVAAGLLGIVFMQVSMLRLNAGISRAVTAAETLEQQNSTLRGDISKLDAGDRISDAATGLGMIRPPAGGVNYLDARKADGRAAAKAIRRPEPVKVAPQAATTAPASAAATTPAQGQAATAQTQTQTAPARPQTAPAQPQTAPPAQTTTPTPTQAEAAAPVQAPAAAATPPPPTTAPAQATPPVQPQVAAPTATAGGATAAQGAQ